MHFSSCSFKSVNFCLSRRSIFLEDALSLSLVASCNFIVKNSLRWRQRAIYLSDSILYCMYSSLRRWYFACISETFFKLPSTYWVIMRFTLSNWVSLFFRVTYKLSLFAPVCINSFSFLEISKEIPSMRFTKAIRSSSLLLS